MITDSKKHVLAGLIALLATLLLGISPAFAADNDFVLSRYATFETPDNADQCSNACGYAKPNAKLFEALVGDFGQVIGAKFLAPAETLGEAGFAVGLVPSVSFIPSDQEHWQKGVEDGDPPSAIFNPTLMVRKGLPFSFEVAGTMGHISGSDMFTVGGHVKWALNEGFHMFPDVAAAGTVNTLVGSKDLQMITAGWDVSVSKAFPISGVMSITPYGGYQQLHAWGWSRLLNVRPQDPRAPRQDPATGDGVNESFNPEFVFTNYHKAINRFLLGTRLNVWKISLVLEGTIGEDVHQLNTSVGLDF